MVAADPVRRDYGLRAVDVEAASALMDQSGGFASPTQSLPVAASVGEFSDALETFGSNRDRYGRFQSRTSDIYADSMVEYAFTEDGGGVEFNNLAEDPRSQTSAPAPMSLVPTSTINPDRPRTVAAGYDPAQQKLTVIFRDGTFYNYFDVAAAEWTSFKQNRSKGRYIKAFLDSKPRGTADVGGIDSAVARQLLYRIARTSQTTPHANGRRARQINYHSRKESHRRF